MYLWSLILRLMIGVIILIALGIILVALKSVTIVLALPCNRNYIAPSRIYSEAKK